MLTIFQITVEERPRHTLLWSRLVKLWASRPVGGTEDAMATLRAKNRADWERLEPMVSGPIRGILPPDDGPRD